MTEALPIDLMIESTGGGSVRHVMDLFDELSARGRDVRLIASTLRSEPQFLEWFAGIDPERKIIVDMRRAPHPSDLAAVLKVRGAARGAAKRRILHAHSSKAGLVASLVSPWYGATFFTPHAYRGMDPTLRSSQRRALRTIDFAISRAHQAIVAVSPEERDYGVAIGLRPEKLHYVPNGVDIAAIARAAGARPARDLSAPVIGFAGRMAHQKNPLLFLDAFAQVRAERPQARAVMIGEGDLEPEVDARIAALGLGEAVSRLGHVKLVERLHDMDVMVHTSRYESLPYVLLEACAVGLPVVSVRNAGSEAIFGTGADLADVEDADGLARRIADFLASPAAAEAARARSEEAARRFSIGTMVDAIEGLYAGGGRARPAA